MRFIVISILIAASLSVPALAGDSLIVTGADVQCNKMYDYVPDNNYGANEQITVWDGSNKRYGLVSIAASAIATIPDGQVIDSMRFWAYTITANSGNVGLYKLYVNIYEGTSSGGGTVAGATDYNHTYHADSSWAIAGAGSAADGGTWHRANGSGADRASTAWSSVVISTAATFVRFIVTDTAWLRVCYEGGYPINFTMREAGTNLISSFAADDYPTTSSRPWAAIYYHSATPSVAPIRKHYRGVHMKGGHF